MMIKRARRLGVRLEDVRGIHAGKMKTYTWKIWPNIEPMVPTNIEFYDWNIERSAGELRGAHTLTLVAGKKLMIS